MCELKTMTMSVCMVAIKALYLLGVSSLKVVFQFIHLFVARGRKILLLPGLTSYYY
jgi:hypothetical protein